MKTIFQFSILAILLCQFLPPSQAHDTDTVKTEQKEKAFAFDSAMNYPVIVQDFQLGNDDLPPVNDVPLSAATLNPADYGFAGAITIVALGLITWKMKADHSDRKSLINAIDLLRQSIEAQRQSQDRLSAEMHAMVKGFESRIINMEGSVKRLEDTIRNEMRRS